MFRKILIAPFIGLIYLYRYFISPLLPGGCRHLPSCSLYATDALRLHGPITGSWLAVKRIARCHPWGTSGFDPVPRYFFKNAIRGNILTRKRYPSCDRLKNH
ncbi:MAG: membrane protein insertion efficiency factor YidD [Bacteroidales bacterium]|nr:membrane protein insertion efficiency factor YidD [Bacteroidales bacterium]